MPLGTSTAKPQLLRRVADKPLWSIAMLAAMVVMRSSEFRRNTSPPLASMRSMTTSACGSSRAVTIRTHDVIRHCFQSSTSLSESKFQFPVVVDRHHVPADIGSRPSHRCDMGLYSPSIGGRLTAGVKKQSSNGTSECVVSIHISTRLAFRSNVAGAWRPASIICPARSLSMAYVTWRTSTH